MIKRLGPFIADAGKLTWPDFVAKHRDFVLVIVPPEDDSLNASDTHECLNELIAGRPALNDAYRVGILRRRFAGEALRNAPMTVGRTRGNTISLVDISVSKTHAYFQRTDNLEDGWTVTDHDSTNGTFINGRLIEPQKKIAVRSLDTLKFSRSVSAVFFSPGDFYHFLSTPEASHALDE